MFLCEPSYVKNFHCIAGNCSDTCCAGWEIVLDEEALTRYENVKGDFGRRLKKEICRDGEEAYFSLTKDHRCPFLNDENLCDIYTELGEEALCDICTEHPRFYSWFGDYTEKGIGLCCEEAERLFFSDPAPLTFSFTKEGDEDTEISEDLKALLDIRSEAIAGLQDRERPIAERISDFVMDMAGLQQILDGEEELSPDETEPEYTILDTWKEDPDTAASWAHELLSFFVKLDYLNKDFKKLLIRTDEDRERVCREGLKKISEKREREYEWEHLAVYLVFRYFAEAVYDQDVITRARLVECLIEFLQLLAGKIEVDGGYTCEKRDELIRMFSREIEYCPENMDALFIALREGEI